MSYDPIHDTYDARPSVLPRKDVLAILSLLDESDSSSQPLPAMLPKENGSPSLNAAPIENSHLATAQSSAEAFSGSKIPQTTENPTSTVSPALTAAGSNIAETAISNGLEPFVASDPVLPNTADIPFLISNSECMALQDQSILKTKLKKSDGEPLDRSDIQFDFLESLFSNETRAFSSPLDASSKLTFAELYIDTIAKSSKCSKVLRERFHSDHQMALAVAKVCLLVNIGRLNTTINFVPDYKLTVRTYHSIPSLQHVLGVEKPIQLQDTPRVKTILKATCEDPQQCMSLDDFSGPDAAKKRAHTTITQLLFLFTNGLSTLGAAHPVSTAVSQLFSNSNLDPLARAQCLLWIIYLYLETDLVNRSGNPFGGPHMPSCPELSNSQRELVDVDTAAEVAFAQVMNDSRQKFLAEEPLLAALKRAIKPKKAEAANANPSAKSGTDQGFTSPHLLEEEASAAISSSPVKADPHSEELELSPQGSPKRRKIAQNGSFMVSISTGSSKPNTTPRKLPPLQANPDLQAEFDRKYIEAADVASNVGGLSVPFFKPQTSTAFNALGMSIDWLASHQQEMVEKSNIIIQQVRTLSKASIASFNKKTVIFGHWSYRYFKYKRSIFNKLVGMTWEDLRLEVLLGAELQCYRDFGLSLFDPKLKFNVRPLHHFDEANERTAFTLQLTSHCYNHALDNISRQISTHLARAKSQDNISLDLEKGSVSTM